MCKRYYFCAYESCVDGGDVVQEPFPSVRDPKVHRPVVGAALSLHCRPPYCYPPGVVYWGEFKSGEKLKPIENNERVSLDYDGILFARSVRLLHSGSNS